jgi:lipopolysaccharide/colanic/teichoic acid biosynthesis glycosyltransferase
MKSKRAFDLLLSAAALLAFLPLLAATAVAVWLSDRHSPFFGGLRAGRAGRPFRMWKFRSMRPDAWKSGVNSTAAGDRRITRIGRFLRAAKLDELPQLCNVLAGEMSLVGPRPQVPADVALYTAEERRLLEARPGITDLASIVFSDEGRILAGSADPDLLYNQRIRPWKSRLALLSLEHAGLRADAEILWWTAVALFSRPRALAGVERLLARWDADPLLRGVARRTAPLTPYPPPGASEIVAHYPRGKDTAPQAAPVPPAIAPAIEAVSD